MITISIDGFEFPQSVGNAVLTWFEYKRERGQKYRSIGRKVLLQRLSRDMEEFGARYVVAEIQHSIENNYQGIFPPPERKKASDHTVREGDDMTEINRKLSGLKEEDI